MLVTNYPIRNEQKAEMDKYPIYGGESRPCYLYNLNDDYGYGEHGLTMAVILLANPGIPNSTVYDIVECAVEIWYKGHAGADLFDINYDDISIKHDSFRSIAGWVKAFGYLYGLQFETFIF